MELRAPVSCCLIVKNEIAQIESCLKSIRPHVEEIVVVDTGSTDGTFDVCARYADVHERFSDCNDSEGRILDFSMARQRSFDLARQPWVMWVDGDDEVVGAENISGLVAGAASRALQGPVMLMFPYEYSHDAAGNVTCLHYRERVCGPKDAFKWVNPVHEVLTPVGGMSMIKTDEVRMVHRRFQSGKTIESGRNLRILKAYYDRVGDSDTRQLYYLGLEYANAGDLRTSIEFHRKYVARSGWDDEKCLSYLEIAKHHQTFGEYDQAVDAALKATTVKENWGETYFSLGKSYYFLAQRGGSDARRNWERSIGFFRLGLKMPPTETILFVNPMERNLEVHRFLNMALNNVGDVQGALESVQAGLKSDPADGGLIMNAGLYEEHIAKQTIEDNLVILLGRNKITMDMASFIKDAVHGRVQVRAASGPALDDTQDPGVPSRAVPLPSSPALSFEKTENPLDIILYVGPGVEPWTPATFGKTGLGGSETMAWEMARRLAAIGNRVRLFGDCPDMEGVFDGVQFLHHDKYKDLSCDILVTSRRPHVVDDVFGVKARARLCWVHDVHCGDSMTHARALRLDRVLCLSRWHADVVQSAYKFLHPSQVIVTRNGIDLSRFAGSHVRNPHRMIYSSSPDRGLQTAITSMAAIRQRVPDAELHVFYGFKTWEASARANGSQDQLNIIALLRRLIEEGKANGVHFHDRVDQACLAREFMSSGVWGYPTWFTETSCQLAGTLVSTSDGMKAIEDVKVGDMVLTHVGRFRKVTELLQKHYDGPLYSVKRRKDFRPVRLTAEHPLWVQRDGKFKWLTPGEIRPKSDSLFTPRMEFGSRKSILLSDYVDMPVVDGKICKNHDHPVYKSVSNEVELTEDVMFILGLFAADGHAGWNARRNAPGAISFALHKHAKSELIERTRQFFGGKIISTSENGVVVTAYCAPWAVFLRKAIGVGRGKRIPSFVWECSQSLQQAFLDGMFAGDGSTSTTPRGNGKVTEPYKAYTSVSPSLAYGFAQLLSNLGFHPGVSYSEKRDAYTLNWSDRRVGWHKEAEGGFVTEVETVQCEHYSGPVYNFEVDEDHSYVTDRTAVHNCITAMEAQAAGLRIVTSPIAALTETVGDRGKMINGDWLSPEYKAAYVDAVVDAMVRNDDSDRMSVSEYAARNFGLDSLAVDWDRMLHQTLDEVERDVVVPYQVVA